MKNFVIACAGLAVIMASSAFAAERLDPKMEAIALKTVKAAASKTSTGFAVALPGSGPGLAGVPASGPNIIGNFALVGEDVTVDGLPCFDCAPPPNGGFGLSLAIPLGYIPTTATVLDYEYTF